MSETKISYEIVSEKSVFVAINTSPIHIYGSERQVGEQKIREHCKTWLLGYELPIIPGSTIKGTFKAVHRFIYFRDVVAKFFKINGIRSIEDLLIILYNKAQKGEVKDLETIYKALLILDLRPPFVGILDLKKDEYIKMHPYHSTFGTGLSPAGKSRLSFTNALPVVANEDLRKSIFMNDLYNIYEDIRGVFPNLPEPPVIEKSKIFTVRTFLRFPINVPEEVRQLMEKISVALGLAKEEKEAGKAPITKPVPISIEMCTVTGIPFVSNIVVQQCEVFKENIGALLLAFSELSFLGKRSNQWIFLLRLEFYEYETRKRYLIYGIRYPLKRITEWKAYRVEEGKLIEDNSIVNDFINAYKRYLNPDEFKKEIELWKSLRVV